MAQSSDLTPRQRVTAAIASALQRWRMLLIILLGAAIVFIIGYGVYTQIATNRANTATREAEQVQTQFDSWSSESDQAKKDEIAKTITVQSDAILKKYPHSYAAQRVLLIRGDMAYASKDWANAAQAYTTLADRFPTSYLAPLALQNAAAAIENKGDQKAAIELDKRIIQYKGLTASIPQALFSLGRLYEATADPKNAQIYYNRLIDQYPSSGWTNLARDRIIALAMAGGTPAAGGK